MNLLDLPPDILQYVILPSFISLETQKHIQDLIQHEPLPWKELHDVKIALLEFQRFWNLSVYTRFLFQSTLKCSLSEATDAFLQGEQQYELSHRQHRRIFYYVRQEFVAQRAVYPPMYVSDGCFGCGKSLPFWWPIAHSDMWWMFDPVAIRRERRKNVSRRIFSSAFRAYGSWLSAGCCSLHCYKSFYESILGDDFHEDHLLLHECRYCEDPIPPSIVLGQSKYLNGSATRPYFCSDVCKRAHFA